MGGPLDAGELRAAQEIRSDQPKEGSLELKAAEESSVLFKEPKDGGLSKQKQRLEPEFGSARAPDFF